MHPQQSRAGWGMWLASGNLGSGFSCAVGLFGYDRRPAVWPPRLRLSFTGDQLPGLAAATHQ